LNRVLKKVLCFIFSLEVFLSGLLTAHVESVLPSTEVIRVNVGDWSIYNVSPVWSSTDPAAEKTEYIKFYENVAWVNNTITDVSFSSSATIAQVIVRSNWHLKNNTEVSFNFTSRVGVNSTEVYEWAPVECIPAIIFPIELSSYEKFSFMKLEVTVNGSTSNEYATQNREVNYIIFQNTMVDTSSMYNLSIYWDKYTGVVCETFFSKLSFFQSYSESIKISFKIIKTNIWQSYEGLFADWNAYRHDLKRTGTYYTNKPEMKGKRILFVPTNTTLYAFDGYSGAKLWEDPEDGGWIQDIICHDSMLILAKENRVVFLDATTGQRYYGIALPNIGCLLINKGILIVVFDYNKINAYNLSDLKLPIWTKKFSCDIFHTFDEVAGSYAVTVEDNLIYVITSDFTIFVLDYIMGEDVKNQKIDVSIEGSIFGGTSISKYNDMLYIVIENSTFAQEGILISNVLVAINLTCFKVAWTMQVASPVPPAISNNVLYITGAVKGVPNWNITGMAFDAFSGKVLWTPSVWASPSKSPVIYRDKMLLVPNFAGLDAYDIKTGKWLWQYPEGNLVDKPDTQLSLVENIAYFGTVNGTIYALDVENKRTVFKVDVAKYIQTIIALASPSMIYTGYLSDLKATYDESTQRMFYNWTVNVESGTGRWTTKFSLYYTVSEYWKDFQSVPATWNITTVEIIPPGLSYQWKVELYDPEGNLVDTKWGQASSSMHTNPTINVKPEKQYSVAGSTLTYTVSITNNDPVDLGPSTFSLTYSVPSGWSASLSKTSVTLNPSETDSSIIVSVTSPATASAGEYTISVMATNMQAESYQGVGLAKYIIKETPFIESVILNRNPGITTMVGFTWSWKPPLYTAKMPSLGVFAQVVVTNPLTQSLSGRLRVYFTDPQGHENEHFTGWAESKIHFDIDARSKKTLFIPINDYGEGLWKIRFALEINGQISDQKSVNLEVLGWTETIDGSKDLGCTIPVQEFLQAERPGITEAALSVLDIIYLLLQAKYGVKDPDSLWNLLPSSGSTYDAVKISNALSCTTWTFLDVEKTSSSNQYVVKATYEVTPYYYFEGQYTFYAVYDRAVTVILLPSGVDLLDSGNADFIQKTSDGETVITWVDNYCDKILRDVTPKKSHQLLIQVSEGRTFKITSHTYFEIGPHWPKPEKNSFPVIDYQAWNQNPNEVYWILMNTKSISRDVVGSTVMLKESQHRLLLHIYDSVGRHVGWNSNNQVEENIPGAIYFDDLNGTILVYLPANITNFKISVNAQYANESSETYELKTSFISSAFVFNQAAYQASIEKGKIQEYEVNISEDGVINLKPIVPQILYQYLLIFSVILIVAVGCGVYIFIKRRRRIVTISAKVS
jgi:hypothetical protein